MNMQYCGSRGKYVFADRVNVLRWEIVCSYINWGDCSGLRRLAVGYGEVEFYAWVIQRIGRIGGGY